jgi:hypothetical protein
MCFVNNIGRNLSGRDQLSGRTVFIGGSRAVSKLNAVIREKLDELIARGCTILVGDASVA